MTYNNQEERSVEDWETKFREQFMRPGAIDMDLQNVIQFLHHQLQKARQDWLREEIVRLKGMKQPKDAHIGTAMPADEILIQCENAGYNRALQTIIGRYQAELDQDKK